VVPHLVVKMPFPRSVLPEEPMFPLQEKCGAMSCSDAAFRIYETEGRMYRLEGNT
jgi:hypothetical protein